jgi:carbamoyltransferase
MYILGINAAFHDSSACLLKDGHVVSAVEEERFTGFKHAKTYGPFNTHALPFHAINYCLEAGGIGLTEVDHVAYSFDPTLMVSGQLPQYQLELPANPTPPPTGPWSADLWWIALIGGIGLAPHLLLDEVPWHLSDRWRSEGGRSVHQWQFHFVEHHIAHAASAFLPSPFERAAILTLDGAGEEVTTLMGVGRGAEMEKLQEVKLPNSLGKFYEKVTTQLGFQSATDEYKVMALASYGEPRYADEFRSLLRWLDDGRYEILDTPLREFCGTQRIRNTPIEQRHFDIAASAQVVLEESCLKLADWLHGQTREENLCLAGGVALNCVMNSRLQNESPFRRVWVQPAATDSGTSLGAALWVWAQQSGSADRWRMEDAYLGPGFDASAIERVLQHGKVRYEHCSDIGDRAAECLAKGHVVAWFQGRMEFGPRALGARSILASPSDPGMVQRLNQLKDREDFRPVAPAVLEEAAPEYFQGCTDSPFMLFVYQVRPDKEEFIPAIRHVDGSARVQTVSAERAPNFHHLIDRFRARTGLPVVVNTSFNSRGKPIVCTPQDALECFYTSPIDALALGDYLIVK